MRILLAHNSTYYPSHGGGDKSNRLLMEALAARGHQVRVVSRVEHFGQEDYAKLVRQLAERGVSVAADKDGAVCLNLGGVDVRTLALTPHLRAFFSKQIEDFDPDVIITSTDDPGQLLFDLAVRAPRARVVYLVRATIAVPFGPDSSLLSATKTEYLRRADKVVGVSNYVANYVRQWTGIPAIHVPISLLEGTSFPELGSFGNPYAAMVNPCLVKGIDIFNALADAFPELSFAAVPTWGATDNDLAELRRRPNVTLLPPADHIEDILKHTRVMLVPSVWAEARSRIVLEAMACGVPVIASDVGGLKEAHLGVPYLLAVNPVTHYKPSLDRNMVPIAEVPPQDISVWRDVLHRLMTDEAHFNKIAAQSRKAALHYAENLTAQPFEAVLEELLTTPKSVAPAPGPGLSDDKRKLLALRLKQKAKPPNPWFAGLEDLHPDKPALFCFPFAGGGTMLYRSWKEALPELAIVGIRLPARETRIEETPFRSMDELIEALLPELQRVMPKRFSFFGHSMGAGIAFEVARKLQPEMLIVSSARAPQLRVRPTEPEPGDAEILEQIRLLEGMPPHTVENPQLLRLVLPAWKADTGLYRNYTYRVAPPLPVPLCAYVGDRDPALLPIQVESWREQTDSRFRFRTFPGGHFYLQTERDQLLAALREDLIW